jgi:ribonuclease R
MKGTTVRRRQAEELLASAGRPMHPREMAAKLGLRKAEFSSLTTALDELVERGRVTALPGGRFQLKVEEKAPRSVRPPRAKPTELSGVLTMHPRGFGFVSGGKDGDVFVPPDAVYEALHGDTVKVEIVGRSPKGAEGRIAGVEKRRNPRVSGILRRKGKSAWVEPDDSRLRGPLVVPKEGSSGRDGDSVIANIVRFPDFSGELPEAEIIEVLGPPGELATEVRKILLIADVREEHAAETLRNAEAMAQKLRQVSLSGRRDLRSVPLPTIDPEDARDHDDAIWVERSKGGYRVYVAIADVSEYVRAGSPLDDEAHERGCTIYLPDRAIPMLPRVLAADLCSLLPEVERYCLCVIADLDRAGNTKEFEIVEGVMRSAARLTYGGVARTLGLDPESPHSPAAEALKDDLEVLKELAEKLRRGRMKRGALDLDLPEARVVVDQASGQPIEVHKRATRAGIKQAYSMVEEMMLLANELVARFLTERDIPAIYRVHGKPDPEKLEKLALVAKELDLEVDTSALAEPLGAADYLQRAQKHPRRRVLEMLLLRSLKQAVYDTGNVGHFGLASDAYVHFTSPIRRYPDLRIHRQIKHLLRGGQVARHDAALDDLQAAAQDSSKKERSAMEVERQVLDLYRAVYMQRHIGDVLEGTVTGLSGSGLFIAIDEPFCDVLVPYEALGTDQYELGDDEISVTGRRSGETIMLGDPLRVEVMDVAIGRRQVLGRRARAVAVEATQEGLKPEDLVGLEPWQIPGRPIPKATRRPPPPTTLERRTRLARSRDDGGERSPRRPGDRPSDRGGLRGAARPAAAASTRSAKTRTGGSGRDAERPSAARASAKKHPSSQRAKSKKRR